MTKTLPSSILAALLVAACSAAPGGGDAESESQAICGSGNRAGCGDCHADPASSKGGTRTCWTCGGDTYTKACVVIPTITATWSGKVWTWTPYGPSNGDFSIPVTFEKVGGVWKMYISSLTIPLGVTVTLQPNRGGSGVVNGNAATLQLPIEASSWGTTIDVTLNLSTDATISPPGASPITVGEYSPSSFQMVGQGTTSDDRPFYAFFSGSISGWPS